MIPISYPSPRVSQLDAHILDSELLSLLKEQLANIFQLHTTSRFSYNQHPELWSLLLNLLVFKVTVWKTGSSYGLALQNLKLTDTKTSKIIGFPKKSLLLGLLIGDYLWSKLQSYLYSLEENDSSREPYSIQLFNKIRSLVFNNRTAIVTKLDNVIKSLNLINFMLFLVNGKYPSIIHRVLGISMTPIVSDLMKFNGNNVNFEFQNRQLVWNVMTEFLVFLLPLLQLNKLRRLAKLALNPKRDGGSEEKSTGQIITLYTNLPKSQCAVCHENNNQVASAGLKSLTTSGTITNPYVTNCGHVYCYVCISIRFNAIKTSGEDLPCLRCGQKLEWFREYGSAENDDDVDEDAILYPLHCLNDDEDYESEEEMTRLEKVQSLSSRFFPTIEPDDEDEDGSDDNASEFSEEEDFEEDAAFDM
ncbi:peroxisome assembly protein [Scheffersomyces xylosifermentans]|uniref:peroxisome assembly protein n=1 Tax=Scheffersomyces xylosifermentans TaxID=1304137 RepID=UPI00315C60C5